MRTSTIANFGLLLLGCALAMPSQPDITIDKRQVEEGDGPGRNTPRPEAWDGLPELPATISNAYERNILTEVLQFLVRGRFEIFADEYMMALIVSNTRATYAQVERINVIVTEFMSEILTERMRGMSNGDMLEQRLSVLTLQQLEREMAEIVRFREENGEIGSRGQESYRYPPEYTVGSSNVLASPFLSLCNFQDRQLIIAKARSGSFTREELYEYLLSQDPFLVDAREYAQDLVSDTIVEYNLEL